MSVSIRISDDMYYEIMKLKADKVSINKTVDMLLGLALKGIEKCEMNISTRMKQEMIIQIFRRELKKFLNTFLKN